MKKDITVPDGRRHKRFKGYTVDEMRYKLLVNNFKIKFQQERLMLDLMPPRSRYDQTSGWSRRLDSMINYGQRAFMAFTMARKIILPVHRYFSR